MNIKIKNFKSLENASIVFKANSLLIGGNGHGKSSVFKAINFLKEYFSDKTSDLFLEDFQLYVNSSYKTSKYSNLINSTFSTRKSRSKGLSFEFPYLNGAMNLYLEQGMSNTSVKLKKFEYRDAPHVYNMENPSFLCLEIHEDREISISLNRDVDALLTMLKEAFENLDLSQKNDEKFINQNQINRSKLKEVDHLRWTVDYLKSNFLNQFPIELKEFIVKTPLVALSNSVRINREKDTKKKKTVINSISYRYFLFDVNKDSIKKASIDLDYLDIIHDKFQEKIIKILKPSNGVAKENKFSINDQRSYLETYRETNLEKYKEEIEKAFIEIKKEYLEDEGHVNIEIIPSYDFIINFCDHFLFKPIFNHRENLNKKLESIIHIPIPRQIYLKDSSSTGENLMKKFIKLREVLYETLILARKNSMILPEFRNLLEYEELDQHKLNNPDFWNEPITFNCDSKNVKDGMLKTNHFISALRSQGGYFAVPVSTEKEKDEFAATKRNIYFDYFDKYYIDRKKPKEYKFEEVNKILSEHAQDLKLKLFNKYKTKYISSFDKRKMYIKSIRAYFFLIKNLRNLKIADELNVNSLEDLYRFLLVKDGVVCGVKDLGFGSQQLLTLILNITVNLTEGNKAKIMMIEEPESNLHPDRQIKLIDMLIDYQKNFDLEFILETHSEYVLRHYQNLVAGGKIKPSDISINYFADKGKINQVSLRDDGVLSENIGKNFYSLSSELLKKHVSIIRKKN